MLMIDERGHRALTDLRAELAWLKAEHPDKVQLIGAAENVIGTVAAAGSVKSSLTDGMWALLAGGGR